VKISTKQQYQYHSCGGKKISFEILRSLFEFLNWMALGIVIFINFFGQLKDWVGQVLFLVSCPKGQVEKHVNVKAPCPNLLNS
jgi:hypothetical protein